MPTPAVPRREALRFFTTVERALRAGHYPKGHPAINGRDRRSALGVALETLGISWSSSGSYYAACVRTLKREVDWAQFRAPKQAAQPVKAPEEALPPRDRQRYEDRIAGLGRQLKDALREVNAADDLRQAVFRLARADVAPPTWAVRLKAPVHGPGIPILFTSDFQWGEFIRKDELGGINEFSHAVAARRYRQLIERTIDLSFNHMVKPKYPGLIYLRGGDSISGDIHQELRETNDLQSIPAVQDLVAKEVWGITQLADKFGCVRVISVPGNHGRTTIKPHSKRYVETNYDTIAAFMIEQWFQARGDARVSFWTPQSGDALFPVYGWKFLLTHGDRIGSRGGQGFIGPAATITRGMKKIVDYYATLGQSIDWVMVGHFHTPMELEYGFCNGSLPGFSEYARDGRFRPAPPKQWLLFVHPEWGITARWPIMLEKIPRMAAQSADAATLFKPQRAAA